MTTLSTAIDASAGFIQTDMALSLGSIPAPISIDSEQLMVTADENGTVYAVQRGVNGSAAAAHARGATVTGNGALRIVGPYAIAWNASGFVNPDSLGPVVATLRAGSFVTAWPIFTISFDQPGQLIISVSENANEPRTEAAQLGRFESASTESTPAAARPWATDLQVSALADSIPRWHYSAAALYVCAAFYPDSASPTAGVANIYLLMQT